MRADLRPELVEQLYASVGDARALGESIARVARSMQAEAAGVQDYDFTRAKAGAQGFLRLEEPMLRRYIKHYSAVNVWMLHGNSKVRPGSILLSIASTAPADDLIERGYVEVTGSAPVTRPDAIPYLGLSEGGVH